MRSDTNAGLKMLGWVAVITIVAIGLFLAASFAGLPQGPTAGAIVVILIICAAALGRVYWPAFRRRDADKPAQPPDPVDRRRD